MKIIKAKPGDFIVAGQQGEELARRVEFDIAEWERLYGPGTVQLLVKRMTDETFYPTAIKQEQGVAIWVVTVPETSVAGKYHTYELRYYAGETLAKAVGGRFSINEAFVGEEGEVPEVHKGWVDQIIATGAGSLAAQKAAEAARDEADKRAKDALESANAAARSEQESKELAKNISKSVAAGVETIQAEGNTQVERVAREGATQVEAVGSLAMQAKENADGAALSEKNAKTSEESAVQSEINARKSAASADLSAGNASIFAKNAADFAGMANEAELDAKLHAKAAEESKQNAKASEESAAQSKENAKKYAEEAKATAEAAAPLVNLVEIRGGTRVEITDVNGSHSFDVLDGHSVFYCDEAAWNTPLPGSAFVFSASSFVLNGRTLVTGDLAVTKDGYFWEVVNPARGDGDVALLCRFSLRGDKGDKGDRGDRGLPGGIQSVNGITPDENGNVEIVAGVQSDWSQNDPAALDYVKNRTHYETKEIVEILPEITLTEDNAVEIVTSLPSLGLVEGSSYIVTVNGQEYICTAWAAQSDGYDMIGLGDGSSWGAPSNGEPFFVQDFPPETAAIVNSNVYFGATSNELKYPITASIKAEQTTIVPLPTKYLPDGVPYVEGELVEILPETTFGLVHQDGIESTFKDGLLGLVAGEKYKVVYNGVEYECTAENFTSAAGTVIGFGNLTAVGSEHNSGEPFGVVDSPVYNSWFLGDYNGNTKVTVSIRQDKLSVRKIDPRCLPNGVPYIEEGGMVEVLPETTLTEENYEADLTAIPPIGLVEGNTYIVTVNGVEYTCVAWPFSVDGLTGFGLGDLYTYSDGRFGTASTGEPFILMELSPEVAAELGVNVTVEPLSENIAFPITFSIKGDGTTIHKLDSRCLPDTVATKADIFGAMEASY